MTRSIKILLISLCAIVGLYAAFAMTAHTPSLSAVTQSTPQSNTQHAFIGAAIVYGTCEGDPQMVAPDPILGYSLCVKKADGTGPYKATHYSDIPYTSSLCLLPSVDSGYQEITPVLCVNTGEPATQVDIAALVFADQCVPGGYVPCSVPCFSDSAHTIPIPCPSDSAVSHTPVSTSPSPIPAQSTVSQSTGGNLDHSSVCAQSCAQPTTTSAPVSAPSPSMTSHHTTRHHRRGYHLRHKRIGR